MENTTSLPHTDVGGTSDWLQLCHMGTRVLTLATFTDQRPVWAIIVSRPKNTVERLDGNVSHAAGSHAWPGSFSSNEGFASRLADGDAPPARFAAGAVAACAADDTVA